MTPAGPGDTVAAANMRAFLATTEFSLAITAMIYKFDQCDTNGASESTLPGITNS